MSEIFHTPFTSLQIPTDKQRVSPFTPRVMFGFKPADRSIPIDGRKIVAHCWNPNNRAEDIEFIYWQSEQFEAHGKTHVTGLWMIDPEHQLNPYFVIWGWREADGFQDWIEAVHKALKNT